MRRLFRERGLFQKSKIQTTKIVFLYYFTMKSSAKKIDDPEIIFVK